MGGERGSARSVGSLQRSQQHPALPTHSWKPDKPKHPLHPSPFLPHSPTPLAELGAGQAAGGLGADAVPLPAVSMFLEESSLGRQHWRQNLPLLLQRLASTLHWVLQGQPTPGSTWGYLVIKVRVTLGRGEGSVPAGTGWAPAAVSRGM